jgi:molecular chaperone GrpE
MTDPENPTNANPASGEAAQTAASQPASPAPQPVPSTSLDRELADTKDRLLRTLADMENLRKRTERDIADARVYGISNFARDIIGVADNMHRAMEALDNELRARADDTLKALLDGVDEHAGKAWREADRSAWSEIRSQPSSGDV